MRPRFMNRGSSVDSGRGAAIGRASMRPRFMNRGSGARGRGRAESVPASMRPRFMNRGSDIEEVFAAFEELLQ